MSATSWTQQFLLWSKYICYQRGQGQAVLCGMKYPVPCLKKGKVKKGNYIMKWCPICLSFVLQCKVCCHYSIKIRKQKSVWLVTLNICFSHKLQVADNHGKWLQCLVGVFNSKTPMLKQLQPSLILQELLKPRVYLQALGKKTVPCGWGSAAHSGHITLFRMVGVVPGPLCHSSEQGLSCCRIATFLPKRHG